MKWMVSVDRTQPAAAQRYGAWVERLDIVPVVVSPGACRGRLDLFDALLLTGGGDVHPDFYGQPRHPKTTGLDPRRDRFELDLVAEFVRLRKPIFGVCRGLQVINVAFRGTLIQDLSEWFVKARGSAERHVHIRNEDARHAVRWIKGADLANILGHVGEVNSAHHQAADPRALGVNLRVAAESPAGVIEAIESTGQDVPVMAVQWHPERLPFEHPASEMLLRYWQQIAAGRKR